MSYIAGENSLPAVLAFNEKAVDIHSSPRVHVFLSGESINLDLKASRKAVIWIQISIAICNEDRDNIFQNHFAHVKTPIVLPIFYNAREEVSVARQGITTVPWIQYFVYTHSMNFFEKAFPGRLSEEAKAEIEDKNIGPGSVTPEMRVKIEKGAQISEVLVEQLENTEPSEEIWLEVVYSHGTQYEHMDAGELRDKLKEGLGLNFPDRYLFTIKTKDQRNLTPFEFEGVSIISADEALKRGAEKEKEEYDKKRRDTTSPLDALGL
jgi:hypothetical protein